MTWRPKLWPGIGVGDFILDYEDFVSRLQVYI